MSGVAGRVALVTGAGSADGIGFATARILAAGGAKVAITATSRRIFERLAELPGADDHKAAFVADLMDAEAVRRLEREVRKTLGPIDILVNNAGMAQVRRRIRSSARSKSASVHARVRVYERSGSPQNSSVNNPISTASRPASIHAAVWLSPRNSRSRSPRRQIVPSG